MILISEVFWLYYIVASVSLLGDVGCCCVFDALECGLLLLAGLFRLNYWFANSVGLMVPIYFGFCFKVIELLVLFAVMCRFVLVWLCLCC